MRQTFDFAAFHWAGARPALRLSSRCFDAICANADCASRSRGRKRASALYGGTERVVSWLTEELVGLGHDVTLFASGESKTNGKLIPVWPKALRLSRRFKDPFAGYAALMEAVAQSADQFDLIRCHLDWIHLPVLKRTGVPLVTTFQWPVRPASRAGGREQVP